MQQNFFKDPWNIFDFITVIGSIVDALVLELGVSYPRISRGRQSGESSLLIFFIPSTGKLVQRRFFKTVPCCTVNQATAARLYNTNITLDIRSIIQSTAICLFADCHAIFYLRNYWHAGILICHFRIT
jgi:hypothetical protein